MEGYKRDFIKFLEGAGVLKFGDFTAKSGRKIPYFINAGDIKTGEQILKLGEFYAKAYFEKIGNKKTVLYGPAYKGIPIAVSVSPRPNACVPGRDRKGWCRRTSECHPFLRNHPD